MSITEELRNLAVYLDSAAVGKSEHGFSPVALRLNRIADHIEQKHKIALCEIADKFAGWVMPPKDADGEVIRLGDVLEWQGASFTVEVLEIDDEGWWTRHDGFSVKCSDARHAQPDSWEAIIEEAASYGDKRWFSGTQGDKAIIAELVERCKRLAGEDA